MEVQTCFIGNEREKREREKTFIAANQKSSINTHYTAEKRMMHCSQSHDRSKTLTAALSLTYHDRSRTLTAALSLMHHLNGAEVNNFKKNFKLPS